MQRTLVTRYEQLKRQVAGNHEKQGFEHTMGPSPAERAHITPMNRDNLRILSELHFALGLSARNEGKYDGDGKGTVRDQACLLAKFPKLIDLISVKHSGDD